jgi:hypothetical protein
VAEQKKPKKSGLIEQLKSDKDLQADKELRMQFLSYARFFDEDLKSNLQLTSVELDAKYETFDPLSWLQFLRHPIVKNYVDGFFEESSAKLAAVALSKDAGKPRDALSIQKSLEAKQQKKDNSHIVVVFMPQKNYMNEV